MNSTTILLILFLSFAARFSPGCTATPSLSVQLVHPKTKAMRTCSARESASKDIPTLNDAVETCARQLEARGFVRTGQTYTPNE
jgi:hypothetical protein